MELQKKNRTKENVDKANAVKWNCVLNVHSNFNSTIKRWDLPEGHIIHNNKKRFPIVSILFAEKPQSRFINVDKFTPHVLTPTTQCYSIMHILFNIVTLN